MRAQNAKKKVRTVMIEQQRVFNKIEEWCERLPYHSLRIEIDLPEQTLMLEKTRRRTIGFKPITKKEGGGVGCQLGKNKERIH